MLGLVQGLSNVVRALGPSIFQLCHPYYVYSCPHACDLMVASWPRQFQASPSCSTQNKRGAVPATTILLIRKAQLFLESPRQISAHGLLLANTPLAWQKGPAAFSDSLVQEGRKKGSAYGCWAHQPTGLATAFQRSVLSHKQQSHSSGHLLEFKYFGKG